MSFHVEQRSATTTIHSSTSCSFPGTATRPEPTLTPPTNEGPPLPLVVVIVITSIGFVTSFVVISLFCFSFKLIRRWICHKHHWRAKKASAAGSCCLTDTNIPLSLSNNVDMVQANRSFTRRDSYVEQSEETLFRTHVPDNGQGSVTFIDESNRGSYRFYESLVYSSPSDTQSLQIEGMQLNPSYSSLDSQSDQGHNVLMHANQCYAIGLPTTETAITDHVYATPKLNSPVSKAKHEYDYVIV